MNQEIFLKKKIKFLTIINTTLKKFLLILYHN